MLVTRRAEILIKADPEQIWDFVNDPAQWMASNPDKRIAGRKAKLDSVARRTTPYCPKTGSSAADGDFRPLLFDDVDGDHIQAHPSHPAL
jgi:hypothetical protein